ncbi:MAG: hypothetical protein K6T35_13960, partial [Meiothermus silvanus]|nr:hypothetical protein [Allomeiothermus silvanus]
REALQRHGGDLAAVLEQEIVVRRLVLSEKDRIGIGTFQPKDEKNQDSTELTGDINYRKIALYGSDSDPRAFNFDGELNIANRGLVEFIEILKLDVAFLYDLLSASQEHKIKSKKFAQTDIDEVILGHTNEPEFKKLQANEFMEALRDRTIKIDVPYNLRASDEVKIYKRDFQGVKGKHIAPHTLEMAAMWATLTRLEPPKKAGLSLLQKLKVYDGKLLPGWLLALPRHGCVNLHPSRLPRHRGASPVQAALLSGDPVTGVSVVRVTEELDAGDILGQRDVPIRPDDTAGTLLERLSQEGAGLLVEVLDALERGQVTARPQDPSEATYCGRLTKEDGRIRWDQPAEVVERHVRAMDPWP